MPIYTLKFEHSIQECATVEVEADDMNQAIAKARDMDTQQMDLNWESDGYFNTDDRLHSVESDDEYEEVDLVGLEEMPTWMEEDLRDQWAARSAAGAINKTYTIQLMGPVPERNEIVAANEEQALEYFIHDITADCTISENEAWDEEGSEADEVSA